MGFMSSWEYAELTWWRFDDESGGYRLVGPDGKATTGDEYGMVVLKRLSGAGWDVVGYSRTRSEDARAVSGCLLKREASAVTGGA
jgi:hypothetical protein